MAGKGQVWERRMMMAGLLVLALLVLGAGYRMLRIGFGRVCDDFLYPYLRLARIGSSALSDRSLLAYSRFELAEKLEALQERERNLALQATMVGNLLQENAQLRRTAGYSPPPEWSPVKAEIIKRDPMKWRERFTLDRGTADGVVEGSAVIDVGEDGRAQFVGVIERVGKHSSTVQTLYNRGLRISARLGAARTVGFVNAGETPTADGSIPVGYLPDEGRYLPDEPLYTTGFERGIPAGLALGELSSVEEQVSLFSGRPYRSGRLRPAADLDHLRFVVIAVPKAGR